MNEYKNIEEWIWTKSVFSIYWIISICIQIVFSTNSSKFAWKYLIKYEIHFNFDNLLNSQIFVHIFYVAQLFEDLIFQISTAKLLTNYHKFIQIMFNVDNFDAADNSPLA